MTLKTLEDLACALLMVFIFAMILGIEAMLSAAPPQTQQQIATPQELCIQPRHTP